jgi:hypothetical protein
VTAYWVWLSCVEVEFFEVLWRQNLAWFLRWLWHFAANDGQTTLAQSKNT